MAVALALLSSLLWGWSDFMGGTLARRVPAPAVVMLSQGVALLVLLPPVLLVGDRPATVLPGLLAGVVGAVGLASFYAALARGTMGVVAPVAATGAVLPVLVGLVRGEHPSAAQGAGIAVALVGVVLASRPELSGAARLRPLLLALVSAICFGTVMVLVAEGSKGAPGAALVTMLALRVTEVGVVAPVALRGGLGEWRAAVGLLVLVGLVDVTANLSYAYASRGGLLSVVALLASLYPVVTVLLARRVHAERLAPVQLWGTGATLLGVALLTAG